MGRPLTEGSVTKDCGESADNTDGSSTLSVTVDPLDLDGWLFAHLVCPRCRRPLGRAERRLTCANGHQYHLTPDGIPVLVLDDVDQTHWAATSSLEHAAETVEQVEASDGVDPQVQEAIGATNGNLYAHLVGRVPRYPIPAVPIEPSKSPRCTERR